VPLVFFAAGFIGKGNRESRTEHRFGPQGVAQPPGGEPDRVEIGRVGPEADKRSGVALADGSGDFQFLLFLPVGKADKMLVAVTLDFYFQAG
jgi:hypothetical protein